MKKKMITSFGVIILVLVILGFSFFYKSESRGGNSDHIGGNYDLIIFDAGSLKDPTLCEKIDNEDYNNYCLAAAREDASLCEIVQDPEVQDRCYSVLPPSLETCGEIKNNDRKGNCLLSFGLITLNSSVCPIIPDSEGSWRSRNDPNIREYRPTAYRDNCFLGIRLETNDTTLCSSIVQEVLIDYCLSPPEEVKAIDLSETYIPPYLR